jgi:hypothetical protein
MNREIFEYCDGQQNRFGDPMRIDRLLSVSLGGDRQAAYARAQSPDPGIAEKGMETLLNGIAKAFDVARYNDKSGQGVMEEQLLELLDKFIDWKNEKKKPSGGSPTLAASTDSPAFKPSSPPMTTKPSSPCDCN